MDDDGAPDARVLILKDQVGDDWLFASSSTSSKGQQLQAEHRAALTFYWPGLGRQVRVRGRVEPRDAQATTDDFLARGLVARSVALASAQSMTLGDRDQCAEAVRSARQLLMDDPNLVAAHWTLYCSSGTMSSAPFPSPERSRTLGCSRRGGSHSQSDPHRHDGHADRSPSQ